ncbi:MAG: saccharopine dehydrogenase NADP-binding domain-containing protein [Novosphingobium sp.]
MSQPKVLLIGGYGGFGARLARRLAGDGWAVLVAGRNPAKAQAFAANLPNAKGLAADRRHDLTGLFRQMRPLLVIDAAGPFQDSDYRVVEACIAAGCNYLDLADARDFVCGIGVLDDAARKAGVAVITGASSVPALSGAVVRALAAGFDRLETIELAISASDRAVAGASVSEAILAYAGKPIEMRRGGRWQSVAGWSEVRRIDYRVTGAEHLSRSVALVDVPDLAILPAAYPEVKSVTFRAGPEYSFQVRALWLASWLVRLGIVRSLVGLARWVAPMQRLTARWCSDRSAMSVRIGGSHGGRAAEAGWTLIAERGDGPEIPTLAAQLFARRIRDGLVQPGARHAGSDLDLEDFSPLFAEIAVVTELVSPA